MVAALDFYINPGTDFNLSMSGSGLGFFGTAGYGATVPVNSYQGTTFITDGDGLVQGEQGMNVTYLNPGSGTLSGGSGIGLKAIPNYQSTLNIRFTNDSAVQAVAAEMRIYDRSDINNGAVGVTTKAAEIIHTSSTQGPTGSGDGTWLTPAGSSVVVDFAASPGESGLYAGDGVSAISTRPDTRHDWYTALSATPTTIGSKTSYGLYFNCEFL